MFIAFSNWEDKVSETHEFEWLTPAGAEDQLPLDPGHIPFLLASGRKGARLTPLAMASG